MASRNRRRADGLVDGDSTPKRLRTTKQTFNSNSKTPPTTAPRTTAQSRTVLRAVLTPNGDQNEPVAIDDDDDDDVIIIDSQEADSLKPTTSLGDVTVKMDKPDTLKKAEDQENTAISKEQSLKTTPVTSAAVTSAAVSSAAVASATMTSAAVTSAKMTSTLPPLTSETHSSLGDETNRVSELKQQLKESEDRHAALQRNVQSLLQIIVPGLTIPALSFVNNIVVEMIKGNSRQAGRDAGDESEEK